MAIKVTVKNETHHINACNTSIRQLELYQVQSVLDGTNRAGLRKICCVFLNAIVNRIVFYCYSQFYDKEYLKEFETIIECINTRNTYSAALYCEYRNNRPIDIHKANCCFYGAMRKRYSYIDQHATIVYEGSDEIWGIWQKEKNQ
jgi:hypothetical protein